MKTATDTTLITTPNTEGSPTARMGKKMTSSAPTSKAMASEVINQPTESPSKLETPRWKHALQYGFDAQGMQRLLERV